MKESITDFREMVRCYDVVHDYNSAINREVRMWRERFIKEKGLKIPHSNFFYSTPSENLMKKPPEEFMKEFFE